MKIGKNPFTDQVISFDLSLLVALKIYVGRVYST